ncbi:MAG: CDP-alcohol phosphatidyltransferase family protein [Defluviitaleaceae bacterium]|nr:CDP-alcohol phosphatidyltransferase family protein [Defluviitaleaceae bacterium]
MRKHFVRMFPALKHLNIPNAITTFGMICGVFACFFIVHGEFRMVAVFLTLAGLMDFVDGFVATKLNQQTTFGKYVDTLVDFFTCGIIPGFLVIGMIVSDAAPLHQNVIIVAAMLYYTSCALWRLAYYNIVEADKYFVGLPVPGSMMMVTMSMWAVMRFAVPIYFSAAVFLTIGTLMVSGIKLPKYGLWQKIMSVMCVIFLILVLAVG